MRRTPTPSLAPSRANLPLRSHAHLSSVLRHLPAERRAGVAQATPERRIVGAVEQLPQGEFDHGAFTDAFAKREIAQPLGDLVMERVRHRRDLTRLAR